MVEGQGHAVLRSLRTPPLHDAIRRQLRQYILDRGLRPGDRLPTEEQLSRELGAGRNAVREALRSLESIGMIEARHGDGRFVRPFTFDAILDHLAYAVYFERDSFAELMEVRGELEVAFVGAAMDRLGADDLAALGRAVEGMRRKAAAGQGFLAEDTRFHALIFRTLGNQLLLRLLDIFWEVSAALQAAGDLPNPTGARLQEVCEQHARIADALERRDADAARAALRAHFDAAKAAAPAATARAAGEAR